MGRMMGMAFFVGVLWVGLEFYTEGPNRAFGGVFGDGTVQEEKSGMRAVKSAKKIQGAYDESVNRVDRLVGD
jgi:hypothetical protein